MNDNAFFQNKPMVHTPEIFAQFASLGLTAPSSTSEVTTSIDQLHAKKVCRRQRELAFIFRDKNCLCTLR